MANHKLHEIEELQTIWPSSPLFEEAPELPSSPTTLFSEGSPYLLSPQSMPETVQLDALLDPTDAKSPTHDHESDTHSPHEEHIPVQFSDSIFEETLSEDETEVASTWDDDDVEDNSTHTFSYLFQNNRWFTS